MFLDSNTSKYVLNSIINKKKINFKKYNLNEIKDDINKLEKNYKKIVSKKAFTSMYKYYFFWELLKEKYSIEKITLKQRNQKYKSNKVNIEFSIFGKILGYNPSLLSMLIFDKQFRLLIQTNNFFEEIERVCELEKIKTKVKLEIVSSISKGELQIITPLCPDYEHVSLGMGLYKYTFNKLNEGLGLIGKRLVKIINDLHILLKKYNIKYKHFLYYGDFEAYSKEIQKRLKISEEEFLLKLQRSSEMMKKKIKNTAEVKLLVKTLSSKSIWIKKCSNNEKKIKKKFDSDVKFKILINEITSSRTELYSSWFPDKKEDDFIKLVIQQGAEYSTMGDIFKNTYNNPVVLGLDHPKMASFYSLNKDIPVIYGKPKYVWWDYSKL